MLGLLRFCFVFLTLLLVSCSRSRDKYTGTQLPVASEQQFSKAPLAWRKPWETFPLQRALNGAPLKSPLMRQGDEQLEKNARARALDLYQRAGRERLSAEDKESLVLRLASTQLSLDRAVPALTTLSDYFRERSIDIEDIDQRFSIVFAYAYGRANDIDQSLAWFSRANRLSGGRGGLHEAAQSGTRVLLRSLPPSDLALLPPNWSSDAFVNGLIGQEQRRRAMGGGVIQPYGVLEAGEQASGPPDSTIQPGAYSGEVTVGILLPLSGKYAALGRSAQQGMQLAFDALAEKHQAGQSNSKLSTVMRDSGDDAVSAAERARELFGSQQLGLLVGPLLSEQAPAVASVAAEARVPMLTFSKKSGFVHGDGVFRLGPTVETQVQSLISGVREKFGLARFASVYPQDDTGFEYALAFRQALSEHGLELVFEESYPPGDSRALEKIADVLETARVEAVFFPDTVATASRFFASLSVDFRRRAVPLGLLNWDSGTQIVNSSSVLDGAVFISPFFTLSSRPVVKQFIETYRARFRQPPDFLAAQAFDAATLIAAAFDRQASEGVPFSRALKSIETYAGLTGNMRVAAGGEIDRTFSLVQLRQGQVAEVPESQILEISSQAGLDMQSSGIASKRIQ